MEQSEILALHSVGRRMNSEFFLQGISFCLHAGETLALAGQNDAGKSALLRLLCGQFPAQEGEIKIDGQAVRLDTPEQSIAKGILRLGQNQVMFANMNVIDNLFFGYEIKHSGALGMLDIRKMREIATDMFVQMDAGIDPTMQYALLSDAQKQMVGLARASISGARILLLDEATAHLSEREREAFWRATSAFTAEGKCIIMVSHDPQEVLDNADQVLVLRQGRQELLSPASELDYSTLAQAAYGVTAQQLYDRPVAQIGEAVLSAERLSGEGLQELSFTLRSGEVTALLGGGYALARILAGLRRADGVVTVGKRPLTLGSPLSAVELGISLAGSQLDEEDIQQAQRMLDEGSSDNAMSRFSLRMQRFSADLGKAMSGFIMTQKQDSTARGGNRKRELVERALRRVAKVYILCQPCTGLDLPARLAIYEQLGRRVQEGAAILLIPSSIDEAMGLCDRVLAFAEDRLVKDAPISEFSYDSVRELMEK